MRDHLHRSQLTVKICRISATAERTHHFCVYNIYERIKDIHSAYTLGSAFYGLYFVVSYPVFALLDEPSEEAASLDTAAAAAAAAAAAETPPGGAAFGKKSSKTPKKGGGGVSSPAPGKKGSAPFDKARLPSLWAVCLEALGAAMAVLMLLDFVRVALALELHVPLARPCKTDAALTCAPFTGAVC